MQGFAIPADRLSALLGEDRERTTRAMVEAQQNELVMAFAALQVPHTLQPGDLVQEKRGLGVMNDDAGRIALMFWRDLDLTNEVDKALAVSFASRKYVAGADCLVAHMSDDNSTLVFTPVVRAHLEPFKA